MNLRDQFQQGMASELTKWQSCDYPLFIILILKIIRKYSYRLCAVPPKWDQIPPWRMTIAFNCLFWTSNDPLKLGAGGGCGCVSQTQGCSGCISGLQPSHPSWKNVQALWSATSKLSCISMWRKFLKQAKKTLLGAKKKKKKALVCTFMCLGNHEIPHYCSLDVLKSFTSIGHETGPRIIHKSVFKAKCVRRDISEKTCWSLCAIQGCGWLHSCLESALENLHCLCMLISIHRICSSFYSVCKIPLPNCTGWGQCCAWEYWEVNFSSKLKTSEGMWFVLRAPQTTDMLK